MWGQIVALHGRYPKALAWLQEEWWTDEELLETLCALAHRNTRTLHRCTTRPEVVSTDAATYRVPDDVTVVLLYNPFGGEVLEATLTRVLESFDREPHPEDAPAPHDH
jgi:hypothetical protein